MPESPQAPGGTPVRISILAAGQALASLPVISVAVSKSLNRIPSARIVVMDGDMPNADFPLSGADSFAPGTEVEIKAGYGDDEETIFKGIVIRHGIRISGSNDSRLVIECQDKAVKMTVGRKNAVYIDKTDSDIISTLIGAHSLTATVDSTTSSYKELVQFYCTDWDFMLSRAEANGLVVVVDDGAVTVRKPLDGTAPALIVTWGIDLMEFQGDVDARHQYSSVSAQSWDPATQALLNTTATPQTLNAEGDLSSTTLAGVVALSDMRLQTNAMLDNGMLTSWSKAQQVKSGLSRILGRVKFAGSALAKPGTTLTLAGLGTRFNGDAFISGVHHEIADGNWITDAEIGLSADWFADRRDLAGPPAAGLLPPVEGLQVGVVSKLDSDPASQYRIQVRVPIMEGSSALVWARLMQYYASNTFGAFFVPEIGDEVVLGYFNHDPSNPIILGSLYSSKNTPAYTPEANNFTKALVTRTKMKVEFNEEKKIITITTPANNKIVLSDEDKSILLQDENNNIAKLSPSGILLDTPKDVKITAKGKIDIEAVGKISVTSSGSDVAVSALNINNTANIGFTAKGNATAELSAAGQTTVKGAMVMIN